MDGGTSRTLVGMADPLAHIVAACAHGSPRLVRRCQKNDRNADADEDVYYYIGERLRLEGEMENMGV